MTSLSVKGIIGRIVCANSLLAILLTCEVKKSETVNKQPGDLKQFTESLTQRSAGMFGQAWMKSLQDNADIEDYRIEIWNKLGNQQQ